MRRKRGVNGAQSGAQRPEPTGVRGAVTGGTGGAAASAASHAEDGADGGCGEGRRGLGQCGPTVGERARPRPFFNE